MIIFVDGKTPFSTDTIASEFNHVYIVVQPIEGEDMYQVHVCKKSGVPDYEPKLPNPSIFKNDENFRNFLLTKGEKKKKLYTKNFNFFFFSKQNIHSY